jgi:hypothetical protein
MSLLSAVVFAREESAVQLVRDHLGISARLLHKDGERAERV